MLGQPAKELTDKYVAWSLATSKVTAFGAVSGSRTHIASFSVKITHNRSARQSGGWWRDRTPAGFTQSSGFQPGALLLGQPSKVYKVAEGVGVQPTQVLPWHRFSRPSRLRSGSLPGSI